MINRSFAKKNSLIIFCTEYWTEKQIYSCLHNATALFKTADGSNLSGEIGAVVKPSIDFE